MRNWTARFCFFLVVMLVVFRLSIGLDIGVYARDEMQRMIREGLLFS